MFSYMASAVETQLVGPVDTHYGLYLGGSSGREGGGVTKLIGFQHSWTGISV